MIVYIMSAMSVIYRLTDSNNQFYIGSTTNLKQRLLLHRNSLNECSSKKLCDGWTCDILEHTDKVGHDLLWLERKYFDVHYGNPLFVNTMKPLITDEERRHKRREINNAYYHRNSVKLNSPQRQAYFKQYQHQNADKKKAKDKERYKQHKAYLSEKIECECGVVISRGSKNGHLKSKKHFKLIQSKNGQNDEK